MFLRSQRVSIAFTLAAVLLASASLVFAQSTTTAPTDTNIDETTATATETTATSTQTATATAAELTQEIPVVFTARSLTPEEQVRITNLAANISNRSEAYIRRFELIMLRIESRTLKMESAGYNMGNTRFLIEEARGVLNDAKLPIYDIDARVNQFVTSEDPGAAWAGLRTSFTQTRDHLDRAKSLMESILIDIKNSQDAGIRPQIEENTATTTASTTDASATTSNTAQ